MGAAARFLQKKTDKINRMTGYPIITEKTINIILQEQWGLDIFFQQKLQYLSRYLSKCSNFKILVVFFFLIQLRRSECKERLPRSLTLAEKIAMRKFAKMVDAPGNFFVTPLR
jgi:hypothetical protein